MYGSKIVNQNDTKLKVHSIDKLYTILANLYTTSLNVYAEDKAL